ncbi:hypothetical protein HMPREF2845_03940 [Rothia sp. HMSC065B04]|uniref:hypothetical protein n=1 Tax=Rothia sp. HMSC065B04 TaxID=1739349 RepID=UPI0008A451E2|nr:hypothetical protein [Rothia sp. HMSC065B04]OFJ76138.1 hypothetical protein HMPREF2845_03940 [Rothia sp. HMSC065B04]
MSQPNNQSIISKALFKGTLMALTNACIIWVFAYIAGFDRSVWMVVIIIAGAALAYVTAFLEARAMQNAARGGDVSTSSSVVDSLESSDSSDEEDDFVDPGPDPDAGDFDAGSSSSSSSSDYSSYSSSDYSGGGDSGGGDSGGSSD